MMTGTYQLTLAVTYLLFIGCSQGIPQGKRSLQNPGRSIDRSRALCPIVLSHKRVTPKVIGGFESTLDTASYMVSLHLAAPELSLSMCSGVLLSSTWVLTAAHCLVATGWTAVIGGTSAISKDAPRIRVGNAYTPKQTGPEYFPYDRDIALVKLEEPVQGHSTFVKINTNSAAPQEGTFARVIGYGLHHAPDATGNSIPDRRLRHGDVPITPRASCQGAYSPQSGTKLVLNITNDMLCAGSEGCGACFGDSGGPLLQFDKNGRPVVVGITSGGEKCGDGRFPAIFCRTSRFVRWMKTVGAKFETTRLENEFVLGSGDEEPVSAMGGPANATTDVATPNSLRGHWADFKPLYTGLAITAVMSACILGACLCSCIRNRYCQKAKI